MYAFSPTYLSRWKQDYDNFSLNVKLFINIRLEEPKCKRCGEVNENLVKTKSEKIEKALFKTKWTVIIIL